MTPPFAAVCFDCDSTLSRLEGIDELAVRARCAEAIIPLTNAAMDGRLALEEVYAQRLDLIRPSRADLAWTGERYIATVVPGARETVAALQALGKAVYVVSGGLFEPVAHLARHLGVAPTNVRAVATTHDANGGYLSFDRESPLARAGGKRDIVAALIAEHGPTALIGDGVTDLDARAAGAFVIGFGGVVARAKVRTGADVFVETADLRATLPHLLTEAEQRAGQLT